jgi:molecular chaperone GrpE (heat shock protein)
MWNPFRSKYSDRPSPALTREEFEDLLERHAEALESRHQDILDGIGKQGRLLARLALRHEDMERKIEGGFGELRATRMSAGAEETPESFEDLYASIDALVGLAQSDASGLAHSEALREGLDVTIRRLLRYLAGRGVTPIGAAGELVDAQAYEVVGTVERPELPAGAIVQLPRIAYRRGGQIVRTGAAIVNRRMVS